MKNNRSSAYWKRFWRNVPAFFEYIAAIIMFSVVIVVCYFLGDVVVQYSNVQMEDRYGVYTPILIALVGALTIIATVVGVVLLYVLVIQMGCGYMFLQHNKKMVNQAELFIIPEDGKIDYASLMRVISSIGIEIKGKSRKFLYFFYPEGIYLPARIPNELREWAQKVVEMDVISLSKEEAKKIKRTTVYQKYMDQSDYVFLLPEDAEIKKRYISNEKK